MFDSMLLSWAKENRKILEELTNYTVNTYSEVLEVFANKRTIAGWEIRLVYREDSDHYDSIEDVEVPIEYLMAWMWERSL